jgi:hypothetical protein
MLKEFVYQNKLYVIIFLYLACFLLLHIFKPRLIYNDDGTFRPFGLGYRHKTVTPMWLMAIVLAILTYIVVHVYLQS